MRVVHILPSLEMGGMERIVAELARMTAARGIETRVICTSCDGPLAEGLRDAGVTVEVCPLRGLAPWLGIGMLRERLLLANPDVVHTHSGVWWRAVAAAARGHVPVRIHTVHGLHAVEPWWGPLEKYWAARLTHAVVGVSPALCEYLQTRCRIPSERVHLLPNGIDVGRFALAAPMSLSSSTRSEAVGVRVGVVARLAAIKNLPLLLRAIAKCRTAGLALQLYLVGEGDERPLLEQLSKDLEIGTAVHFLGELADPAPFLAAIDIFVLPSVSEGTSIALLEAMAAGRPCIATAVGGSPDVLDHGNAGVLVPSGDLDALVAALRQFANDASLRRRLGADARARVESSYSLDAMVDRYVALYAAPEQRVS